MPSQYIGLLVGATTQTVYMVINPDQDEELDNPNHLTLTNDANEPVQMVKIERDKYGPAMTAEDVHNLIVEYYIKSNYGHPYKGKDIVRA